MKFQNLHLKILIGSVKTRLLVGRSVGWSVIISLKAGSCTSTLLSDHRSFHLFFMFSQTFRLNYFFRIVVVAHFVYLN